MKNQRLLGLIVTVGILGVSSSASAFNIVFGENTTTVRTDFTSSFNTNSSSSIVDTGIDNTADPNNNFGASPDTTTTANFVSVSRSGTINGKSFSYTAYDIDFSNSPTNSIAPGTVGDDIAGLDNVVVEKPAKQDSAEGDYAWGLDSSSGANSTSNAALFDFSGNSIGHFGVDLHDFEAGTGIDGVNSGVSGAIRIYNSGSLIFSYNLQFTAPDGGGSTDNPDNTTANDSSIPGYGNRQSMFVGITAENAGEFFDQIVFVLGDDDVGNFDETGTLIVDGVNSGYTERWAADGFTFGEAYQNSASVPFEFSPTLGFAVMGGLWLGSKIKQKS